MNDFRDMTRKKMESIPFLKSCLNASMIIWMIGTILFVLGMFITFAGLNAMIVADLFQAIGFWMLWFGVVLSFVKKDENGVMIPLAAAAVTYLIMFIIYLVFHSLSLGSIIHFFAYGVLAFFAFQTSTLKRRIDNNKAQSMTNYRNTQGGYICPKCGAIMTQEAMFCTVCGTKRAQQRFCTSCGRPLLENDLFCPGCGHKQ